MLEKELSKLTKNELHKALDEIEITLKERKTKIELKTRKNKSILV